MWRLINFCGDESRTLFFGISPILLKDQLVWMVWVLLAGPFVLDHWLPLTVVDPRHNYHDFYSNSGRNITVCGPSHKEPRVVFSFSPNLQV